MERGEKREREEKKKRGNRTATALSPLSLDLNLDLLPPTPTPSAFRLPPPGPRQAREREPDRARLTARHLVPRRGHELGARLPSPAGLALPSGRRRVGQARQGGRQRRRPLSERQRRSIRRRVTAVAASPSTLARDPQAGPGRLLPARQAQQHFGQQSRDRRRRIHPGAKPPQERQDGHGAGEEKIAMYFVSGGF